jgi:hypothetical protein
MNRSANRKRVWQNEDWMDTFTGQNKFFTKTGFLPSVLCRSA